MTKYLFLICLLLQIFRTTKSETYETFTYASDLEKLLPTELAIIDFLEKDVDSKETDINVLKKFVESYRKQYEMVSKNVNLIGNPITFYLLMKRLTVDWLEVENLIKSDLRLDHIEEIAVLRKSMTFPTEEDLNEAVNVLAHLQETYSLDTRSLANGEIKGFKYSPELSASDCFELGKRLFKNEDYDLAQLWMEEADSRFSREVDQVIKQSDILEYRALAAYHQGNASLALALTKHLLELEPTNSKALKNRIFFGNKLVQSIFYGISTKGQVKNDNDCDLNSYEALCRGDVTLPSSKSSKLKCYYFTKTHPFLQIAPFKVEEAYHQPDILIFYDVISNREITTLKTLATPKLMRSTVVYTTTGKVDVSKYRKSKSTRLEQFEHEHIIDVTQRVSDMTGLTMWSAEPLQIVTYGIGGYFVPHYDSTGPLVGLKTGDRIATVLFYMNNVEQGGATVFPHVNVALWPQKGAAAFWHNLHPSGDGDKLTEHAACPILVGTKWVSNKWIHEHGQEFLRPCTLERPSEDLVTTY